MGDEADGENVLVDNDVVVSEANDRELEGDTVMIEEVEDDDMVALDILI